MSAFVGVAANIPSGPFDIILANINRNILVNDGETYVNVLSPTGILAVSGFLETDEAIIISHFRAQGLIPIKIKKEENWRCIVFQNTD
jgi:ribosomal protein L11 methyltransferase